MKEIVIVTTSYPASQDGSEAAGSFVKDFADTLGQRCRVKVLCPGPVPEMNPQTESEHGPGVEVYRYFGGDRPLSLLNPVNPLHWLPIARILRSGSRSLEKIVRENRIDHIFALWVLPSGYWAMKVGRKHAVPYSTWALGSDIWSLGRLPLIRSLLRRVLNRSYRNFADGYQLKQDVMELSGIDCEFLPSTRVLGGLEVNHEASDTKTGIRLAFLGRWHVNKGVDTLLDALDSLDAEHWDLIDEVRIFGGGPLEELVRTKVGALQEKNRPVAMGGFLKKSEAEALYAWTDYVLIPSRIESIPVVFSDAMQSGKPVISTPVGDLRHLLENYRCGVLAESSSADSFLTALQAGLAIPRPARYFAEGIEKAGQQFSIQASVESFLKAWN